MFDLSPEKIFILGLLALVVLGPNRLPEAARTLGRFIGAVRSMSSSFQSEVKDAIGEPMEAFQSAVGDFRPATMRQTVRQHLTDTIAPANGTAPASVPAEAAAVAPAPAPVAHVMPDFGLGAVKFEPDDPSLN